MEIHGMSTDLGACQNSRHCVSLLGTESVRKMHQAIMTATERLSVCHLDGSLFRDGMAARLMLVSGPSWTRPHTLTEAAKIRTEAHEHNGDG